jgi:uncharacterized membrane protein
VIGLERTARLSAGSRLSSIDALRGVVMIVMALDHVRDFFHVAAASFSPTDLTRTTPILFFTRWITHFCMPVFMFAAGMGAFLFAQRHHSRTERSRFLVSRGLWFILLELTVMQVAYNFSFSLQFMIPLLILWIFGLCMIAMAALAYLPLRWLAVVSIAAMVFHNGLDAIKASQFGSAGPVWNLVHQPGVMTVAGKLVLAPYTFLPWVAVMAAGFCFAGVFQLAPARRQRIMAVLGVALTLAFVVIRSVNRYGDPAPWSHQKSTVFTVLSFLNCTKYPASLDFLLMTLGPALLVLAYFDRRTLNPENPLFVFGRVPMFYFILHFYLIHTFSVAAAWLTYGTAAARFTFMPVPSMGGSRDAFPANFGYALWVVYGVWILVVALLYPPCRWFARVKATHRNWWLSYL